MIKNEKQYRITQKRLQEFTAALKELKLKNEVDLMDKIMIDSINSQIITFHREINEYEILRDDKPQILISSVENIPETLIKARLIRGLTQKDLAQKTGLQEQQIQRYEADNYSSANFGRVVSIAHCMGLSFDETRVVVKSNQLFVEGVDPEKLSQATSRLHSRGTLFQV